MVILQTKYFELDTPDERDAINVFLSELAFQDIIDIKYSTCTIEEGKDVRRSALVIYRKVI